MHPFLALLILLLEIFNPQDNEVRFVKESITMKIEKGYFYVSGTYHLRNFDKKNIMLTYPFPIGHEYGEVDSIYLFNLTINKTVNIFKSKRESILFSLDLAYNEETALQISYRQKLNSNVAKYILRSTKVWQMPLESAFYQLIVPETIKVNQFSILPDDSLQTQQEKVYYWKRFDYMPEKDMVFHFELDSI